jgi:hypothetical protein
MIWPLDFIPPSPFFCSAISLISTTYGLQPIINTSSLTLHRSQDFAAEVVPHFLLFILLTEGEFFANLQL